MIRSALIAAASITVLSACASTDPAPTDPAVAPAPVPEPTSFERAMITVEGLEDAGNPQTAIDRLTQLLGEPDLSDEEKAATLFKRGELRLSDTGFDTFGAISDFEEIVTTYPGSAAFPEANEKLGIARGKATSLTFVSEQADSTREQRFNALFTLGEHQDAIDLMTGGGLTPSNEYLVAMYQIGYLCEDEELTGQAYEAVEPNGTQRTLRFCDLGK